MAKNPPPKITEKINLHPRNRHRGRYDFPKLADALPALVGMLRHEKNVYLNIDDTPPGFVTIEAGENAS